MGDLKYPPDADTLRRLWEMTDPEELRRRGISTEAYFREALREDDPDESNGATQEEIEEYYRERDDYDEDEEPYIGDWPPPEWRNPELLAYLAELESGAEPPKAAESRS